MPFAGILLSIALFPLSLPTSGIIISARYRRSGRSRSWCPSRCGSASTSPLYEVLHTVLLEYMPFIILLLALFTVAGGVR